MRASTLGAWLLSCLIVAYARDAAAQDNFLRGDPDGDGAVHFIVDASFLSQALFGAGPSVACDDAADANDDGVLNVDDVVFIVSLALSIGPGAPSLPYPSCGPDPTADSLGCAAYSACGGPATVLPIGSTVTLGFLAPVGAPGSTVAVGITLDSSTQVHGWSFGVCHDSALASVLTVTFGPSLVGSNPDFEEREVVPSAGWSGAALMSFTAAATLPPGPQVLYTAHYDHFALGEPLLAYCHPVTSYSNSMVVIVDPGAIPVSPQILPGTLGAPPPGLPFKRGDVDSDGVVNFIADANALSYALAGGGPAPSCFDTGDADDDGQMDLADVQALLQIGFLGVGSVPPPHPACGLDPTLDALPCAGYSACGGPPPPPPPADPNVVVGFTDGTDNGTGGVIVTLTLDNLFGDLAGWSFGVCHDPALAAIVAVDPGGTLIDIGPDFSATTLIPGEGFTVAVLLSFTASVALPPGSGYELYTIEYDLLGVSGSPLTVCSGLGLPPVPVTFTSSSGGPSMITPTTVPGSTEPVNPPLGSFIRADANADSVVNIADTISIIIWQFVDGPTPPCLQAADANNDGANNIADAIWITSYLFLDGPPPPAPFPICGLDPTPGTLRCAAFPPCQ
ncbi:MAG: hypothetical protein ACKVX7_03515 [Planctomycetota bacterium]